MTTVELGAPSPAVILHGAEARGKERATGCWRSLEGARRVGRTARAGAGWCRGATSPWPPGWPRARPGFAALALAGRAAAGLSTTSPRCPVWPARGAARRAAASRAGCAPGTAGRATTARTASPPRPSPRGTGRSCVFRGGAQPRGEGGRQPRRHGPDGGNLPVLPGVGARRGGRDATGHRRHPPPGLPRAGRAVRAQRLADARHRARRGPAALLPPARDARAHPRAAGGASPRVARCFSPSTQGPTRCSSPSPRTRPRSSGSPATRVRSRWCAARPGGDARLVEP